MRWIACRQELLLIEALLDADESDGVIGGRARKDLRQVSSMIYWSGLERWGIRRVSGSREQGGRSVARSSGAAVDDDGQLVSAGGSWWHSGLPEPPEDWPTTASLTLRSEDAEYLRERIRERCAGTVLATLAERRHPWSEVTLAWQLEMPDLSESQRRLREALAAHAPVRGGVVRAHHRSVNRPDRQPTAVLLDGQGDLLLDQQRFAAYGEVDPGGPRLRELAADVIDTEAWRLLWIPPSLPYHRFGGAYARPALAGLTKRLVFSAWRAVPRAVAGLLSYLAERRLTLEADEHAVNTPQRRAAQRNRLAFAIGANDRRTGMPTLALLYPSPALAQTADPRRFAASHPDATIGELLDWATG